MNTPKAAILFIIWTLLFEVYITLSDDGHIFISSVLLGAFVGYLIVEASSKQNDF